MRVAVELAAVAEDEPALAVVAVHAEDGLPQLGGAVGADGTVERDEVVRLFAATESVRRYSEYPEIPAILARRVGTARPSRCRVSDIETTSLTEMGIVSDETQPDRSRQPVSQVIRTRARRRHIRNGVGDVRELALPDEMERVLGSTAAGGLIGDENVDLRILPVTHVVHERDLGPHEIEIADIAIEKDAEPDRRRNGVVGPDGRGNGGLRRRLLPLRGRKSKGSQDGRQEQERHASRAHQYWPRRVPQSVLSRSDP